MVGVGEDPADATAQRSQKVGGHRDTSDLPALRPMNSEHATLEIQILEVSTPISCAQDFVFLIIFDH